VANIIKEQKNGALFVRIIGTVDENTSFEQMIGPPSQPLIINCKEVSRINSIGVKTWIKYFHNYQAKNIGLTLTECSTAIIEQMNLIANFSCGAKVESIYVPFLCSHCRNEMVALYRTEEIKKLKFEIPKVKCTKCGKPAEFDDTAEEFFTFLIRPPRS
jgi:anti-anti-sigma regulatory factor